MSSDFLSPETASQAGSAEPSKRILHNKQELASYLKTVNKLFARLLDPDEAIESATTTPTSEQLKSASSQTDFDASATGGPALGSSNQDVFANDPNNGVQPIPDTKVEVRTQPEITERDFVAIPLIVDVWKMQCLQGETVSTIALHTQSKYFATGYVVWKILKHYFPSDVHMELYKYPQTRKQYAEVWSHVDLVLQKHNLTRIPIDVIASVLDHHQAGQAVLLMILYETLTNLKISHPIPRLKFLGNQAQKKEDGKRKLTTPTAANRGHGAIPYTRMLLKLFTTNQHLAFARSHRKLRPPSFYRPVVSQHGLTDYDDENSLTKRLTRPPNGARCHIFHEDRHRYIHLIPRPDQAKTLVSLLRPPFFPDQNPVVKQPRAAVVKVPIQLANTT